MPTKFKLLHRPDGNVEFFQKEVQGYLDEGWALQGQPFVHRVGLSQALVKHLPRPMAKIIRCLPYIKQPKP